MSDDLFERLPPFAFFLLSIVLVMGSIVVGYWLAKGRKKRFSDENQGPVSSIVAAVLALLGFILAFTFSMAANRFDTRKQLLLDQVNAIGTAVLRAGMLPEPHRTESRRLFNQYVDTLASLAQPNPDLAKALISLERIQDQLWANAASVSKADLDSDIGALYVSSLNTVFDLQTSRVTVGLQYHIPFTIWVGLFAMTVLSMTAVGYHFGVSGRHNLAAYLILTLSFSAVILLIADLDHATKGSLRLSQEPMLKLQEQLKKDPALQ